MLRAWLAILAVLVGCDSIFGVRTVGPPGDAADAMTDAPILQGWKATAAGWFHSCGIRADDSLWCWGSNEVGELGLGLSAGLVEKPTRVSSDGFSELSTTYQHTCALGLDAVLRCWGDNTYGQLGTGNLTRGYTPKPISGSWKHVSAGALTTCAIRSDDTLWCWGWNAYAQVGNGTTMQTPVPTQVGADAWLDVDVGWYHACGIKTDHSMWCWGYEGYGEFGNGDDGGGFSYVPAQGPPGSWTEVQAGAWATCGVTSDSQLRCWGLNTYGQLGNATLTLAHTPQPALIDGKDVTDWLSVTIDHLSTCGIRQDASMWCWGNDRKDQLGFETADSTGLVMSPVQTVQVSPSWRRIDLGVAHACGITTDNELYCVGDTARGQLGTGATDHPSPHAMPLSGLSLALSAATTCGVDSGGAIHCAGQNLWGGIGDQTTRSYDMITTMSPALQGVVVVAPGYGHTCASTATAAYCWGWNAHGQLGNGTTTDSFVPVMTTSAPPFVAMASYNHTCGIDSTGVIYCWGENAYGQVGDGSGIDGNGVDRTTPFAAGGGGVQIVVSPYHTCTRVTTGALYCWGRGTEGQLGLGDYASHSTAQPLPIDGTTAFIDLTAGWYHTCAISTAGVLYCWGGNQYGQLGEGDLMYRPSPTPIGAATWKSVAAGIGHTCAVRTDGTLWCWGRNTRGQLGFGSYDDRIVPGKVGEDADWLDVYAGDEHTCGVKTTGQVLCWGANEEGETPDGTAWTATMVRVP